MLNDSDKAELSIHTQYALSCQRVELLNSKICDLEDKNSALKSQNSKLIELLNVSLMMLEQGLRSPSDGEPTRIHA